MSGAQPVGPAYAGTALAVIAGSFAVWAWLRLDRSPW